MKQTMPVLLGAMMVAAAAHGQTIAKVYDSQLTAAEREMVPLAEAVPADRYNFAPANGEFAGVRTFGLQVRHLATVIYEVSSAALEEKMPVETGKAENGSDKLATKEQVVQYLKDAFTYAHKATLALTAGNEMAMVKSPFGDGQMSRSACLQIAVWHSFDHYGQMVVYARMNGIVPPASRR